MTTDATIGHNTLFQRDPGTGSYATLAEVTSITPPNLTRDTIDATHMLSTSRYREFISGLRDGGEATIELNFIPGGAAMTSLLADFISNAVVPYKILFPNSTAWTFDAFVTSIGPEAPLDDKMSASITFKITGVPVLA